MTRRSQRRGILLLIVLSLLVLFVLIGVTFLVVANQYHRVARAVSKHDQQGDDPAKELDGALYLLLRGTTDTSNLAFRHSLFGDLYGRDGFAGVVLGRQDEAGGEFIRLTVQLNRPLDPNYPIPPLDKYYPGLPNGDYFAGCVFTLTDGSSRGQSARIVRYSPPSTNPPQPAYVVVHPFESQKIFKTQFEPTGFAPKVTDRFVINGRPFNGTGDGFNVESGELDQEEPVSQRPVALLPNYRQSDADQLAIAMGLPRQMITMGDSDESWDAVDYQNFLLARVPTTVPAPPQGIPMSDPLIPSFHRPFLIDYWMQDPDDTMPWDGPNVDQPWRDPPVIKNRRRMVVARPMQQDHPYFTGSNPAFSFPRAIRADIFGANGTDPNPDGVPDEFDGDGYLDVPLTLGPWDVDNDNDGINDSIWVDLGMPAKSTPDGRLYKPLFAVLCVDLDGRLNLNAHGVQSDFKIALNPDNTAAGASGSPIPIEVTRGQGYGPAEIRLEPALNAVMINTLLQMRWASAFDTGFPGYQGENPVQGLDTLSYLKQWDMPRSFQTQFQVTAPDLPGSAYQTPSDLRGIGGVYLDLAGQPRYAGMMLNNETIDDPYETNLVEPNASDSLFTVNDLEQLLRSADMDTAAFSGRLRTSLLPLPAVMTNPHQLRRFTTSSFDIPVPNVVAPLGLRKHDGDGRRITDEAGLPLLGLHTSLSDLMRARLIANGFAKGQPLDMRFRLADAQLQLMLAPELRQGRKLDINRWFGSSRDDSGTGTNAGKGVVDEPSEHVNGTQVLWAGTPFQTPVRFATNDPHFDPSDPPPHLSRQVLARHLYCLMMLLIDSRNGDTGLEIGTDFLLDAPNLPLPDKKRATARRIAQWAINVVDFRDPDAIMTPFEFDLEPFNENGWSVDDDYRTRANRETYPDEHAIVWGCEHPEMVITETMAWHDRRVRDTAKELPEEGDAKTRKLPAGEDPEMYEPDEDLDQYRIPQGTLMLELYCGRNRLQNNPIAPNELYRQHPATGALGLDLSRVVDGSPVWRIAIGQSDMSDPKSKAVMLPARRELDPNIANPTDFDPNDESMLLGMGRSGTMTPDTGLAFDRYVIFSNGVPPNVAGDRTRYYYNRGTVPLVQPGQYAVIGPYRPLTLADHAARRSTITMGSKQNTPPSEPSEPSDQQIVMTNNGVIYRQLANGAPLVVPNVKPVVSIMVAADIIDAEWTDPVLAREIGTGINVSEPLPMNYYDEPTWPDSGEVKSYYGDVAAGGTFPDVPFDENGDSPFLTPDLLRTGTNPSFRVAVLQRLADPTRGWDATENPYISIDAQPIDLTVFNGEDESDRDPASWDRNATYANGEPYDPVDDEQNKIARHFKTRERGGEPGEFTAAPNPILWNPLPGMPPPNDAADQVQMEAVGADAYWKFVLNHSLGYLNKPYENLGGPPRLATPDAYIGDPTSPFSWLVWNNRPYVSHLELMQVPSSAPWRLLYEFRGGVNGDQYDSRFYEGGFAHLLNFFHSDNADGTHANLCRIFDYVEVPSRYVGTEKRFGGIWSANIKPFASPDLWEFELPNNTISMFRDPGRINVNTIPDATVWQGIDPRLNAASISRIEDSLKGKPDGERRPAFYANPVRTAASAGLMPTDDLIQTPVDATLLRSRGTGGSQPLFDFDISQAVGAYENPEDNSYFRHHKLQRLGNLLTTHSNVYAIWITVGYFEVHPWNPGAPLDKNAVPFPDAVHPDGFQLGLELGSDTGEIKRHRAFYIIDRSVPVAFEPGENHNIDKAILLRRMIE